MNKNLILVALVIMAGLYGFTKLAPAQNPLRPDGPDMVSVFNGANGKQDAKQFSALCQAMHDRLQDDWQQSTPYLATGAQVDTLRVVSRRVLTGEKSFVGLYPALKDTLDQHFAKHVGDSGGPLTSELKAGWLKAYKELADCANYAADNL